MTTCDHIAHRLAAGERLNDDQRAHTELCTACGLTLEATSTLGAIGRARAEVVPGPGFSSRVASRAWDRVAQRRRNRVLGVTFAASGAVAAAALAVALWRGDPPTAATLETAAAPTAGAMAPVVDDVADGDADRDLLWLTDAERALTHSANWDFIEAPVAPYALLLDEGALEENDQ